MKVSNIIPMNLQLFASSEGIESPVNAGPVGNVDPQQTIINDPINNNEPVNEPVKTNNVEPVDPQQNNKPVQSVEENAKFAAIRREAEAKADEKAQKLIDQHYSELYGEQYGINSKADYDNYVAAMQEQQRLQAEAERTGASPELLREIAALKAFKNETIAKEQQKQSEENVKAVQKEAEEIIAKAKEEGLEITPQQLAEVVNKSGVVNLQDAYKLLKADVDVKSIRENAVKEYIEGKRAGKIPVEGSGSTPVVASESPKDFNQAREGALQMLRASKIFNN